MTNLEPSRVVPVVLKTKSGQLIMQQRDHNPLGAAHLRGKVDFFGGHSDPGETPVNTAIREIEEELELKMDVKYLKHIGSYQKIQAAHGDNNFVEVVAYDLPVDPRKLVVHEGAGYVLVTADNVNQIPLAPFSGHLVKYLLGIEQALEEFTIMRDLA